MVGGLGENKNVCDGKRNNCIPFTADTCRQAGKKLGYSIGGYGFPFISNSSNQSAFASGCYIYGNNTVFLVIMEINQDLILFTKGLSRINDHLMVVLIKCNK